MIIKLTLKLPIDLIWLINQIKTLKTKGSVWIQIGQEYKLQKLIVLERPLPSQNYIVCL